LIGKSLATVTDMNCDNRQKLSEAAAIINGISGEDFQTVNRKNKDFWSGKLPVRFILATNVLPNFATHAAAMARRLLIVPFDRSFDDIANRNLTEKLERELAGILNWCLDKLDALQARGDFVEPAASLVSKQRLIYRSSPIHGFIEERCAIERDAGVDKDVLYADYTDYCNAIGARPVALHEFSENLSTLYPSATPSRRRLANGKQRPCYRGVRLSNDRAAITYRLDMNLVGLFDAGEQETLALDATGWPVPRNGADEAERGTLH